MKILFITHEASRTGAPIVLLHFLKWLRINTKSKFDTLCLRSGELVGDFQRQSRVFVLKEESLLFRVIRKASPVKLERWNSLSMITARLANNEYEVIYSNTALSLRAAVLIARSTKKRPRLIGHIHEGYLSIKQFAPDFDEYRNEIDQFVTASKLVKESLLRLGVEEHKIKVIYEFSNLGRSKIISKSTANKIFTIGGSGVVNWRKGTEFFVMVANHCQNYYPDLEMEFLWIGKAPQRDMEILEEDLRKSSLVNIRFLGEVEDPGIYFQQFDLFLMTSREDPFPLVCIEVGQCGVPLVCFAGATGTEEVLDEGGGKVVRYMDIQAMAEIISVYYHDRRALKQDGERAREIFSRFTPEEICPQLFELLSQAGPT